MTSRDAHRQRFLINRLYAIGVLTVAAAIFGAIAAFLLYSDSGWDPATVGNQIIARNPGPCPPPGSGQPTAPQTQPQADGSFIPPFIRAQLAASPAAPDQTPVPCKPLMGALAPQGYYEQPVPGTGNWLQFQIDPPKQSPCWPADWSCFFGRARRMRRADRMYAWSNSVRDSPAPTGRSSRRRRNRSQSHRPSRPRRRLVGSSWPR
jgi:hypothetical protein